MPYAHRHDSRPQHLVLCKRCLEVLAVDASEEGHVSTGFQR